MTVLSSKHLAISSFIDYFKFLRWPNKSHKKIPDISVNNFERCCLFRDDLKIYPAGIRKRKRKYLSNKQELNWDLILSKLRWKTIKIKVTIETKIDNYIKKTIYIFDLIYSDVFDDIKRAHMF